MAVSSLTGKPCPKQNGKDGQKDRCKECGIENLWFDPCWRSGHDVKRLPNRLELQCDIRNGTEQSDDRCEDSQWL